MTFWVGGLDLTRAHEHPLGGARKNSSAVLSTALDVGLFGLGVRVLVMRDVSCSCLRGGAITLSLKERVQA